MSSQKRPTTAVVAGTVGIVDNHPFVEFVERVTPLQVARSGWANDQNALSDDERVIVQVAVERVLRKQTGTRAEIKVSVGSNGYWDAWVTYYGDRRGSWSMIDGSACMNEVRRLQYG